MCTWGRLKLEDGRGCAAQVEVEGKNENEVEDAG
jgi:hypothetical protein